MRGRCPLLPFVGLLALTACSNGRETLPIGAVAAEGERVVVNGFCHSGARVDADESAGAVELRLTVEAEDGGDCVNCIVVELASEVGERRLVDASTGDVIEGRDQGLEECFALVP